MSTALWLVFQPRWLTTRIFSIQQPGSIKRITGRLLSGQIYTQLFNTGALTFRECVCVCVFLWKVCHYTLWWCCESCNFRGMKGGWGWGWVSLSSCDLSELTEKGSSLSYFVTSARKGVKVRLQEEAKMLSVTETTKRHFLWFLTELLLLMKQKDKLKPSEVQRMMSGGSKFKICVKPEKTERFF